MQEFICSVCNFTKQNIPDSFASKSMTCPKCGLTGNLQQQTGVKFKAPMPPKLPENSEATGEAQLLASKLREKAKKQKAEKRKQEQLATRTTQNNSATTKPGEFPKVSGWAQFWYLIAGLNGFLG